MQKAILKIDYECNNNCIFCHAKTKKHLKIKSTKEIVSKIRKIKHDVDCIILSGGEPLLNKNFIHFANIIKKEGLCIGISTNSRIMSLQKAKDQIEKIMPSDVYTTFHSNQKTIHEKITRVPGSYQQTIEGIKNLLQITPNLMVNIVLLNQNINTLKNTIAFLQDIKIKNIKLSFVEPVTKSDISHTPEITKAAKKVKEIIDAFPVLDIGWDGFPLCLMNGYENKIKNLNTCNIKYISEAWEDSFFKTDEGNKIKKAGCKYCTKETECEGIYEKYLELKDFTPIPYKGPQR